MKLEGEYFLGFMIPLLIVGVIYAIYMIYTFCINHILLFSLLLFSLLLYIICILCEEDDYFKTKKFQKRKKKFDEYNEIFETKIEEYCQKRKNFINKYSLNLVKKDEQTNINYSSPLNYFKNYYRISCSGNKINIPIPMDKNTLSQLILVKTIQKEMLPIKELYEELIDGRDELEEYICELFPEVIDTDLEKLICEIRYRGRDNNIIPSFLFATGKFKLNIFKDENYNPIISYNKINEYSLWLKEKIEYENKFYSSKEFISLKTNLSKYIQDCNELNKYITELNKTNYLFDSPNDVDVNLNITDSSKYNMNRFKNNELQLQFNVCDCSLSVFNQARRFPVKYFFKYFGLPVNEGSLELLEEFYNKILSIKEGCNYLEFKKEDIEQQLKNTFPTRILEDTDTLYKHIDFLKPIKIKEIKFPIYYFRYISTGGNAKQEISIEFNLETIESFSQYIINELDKRATVKYQRQLMTPKLRESIKQRDNYTCCKCGISINDEPHLLLEVDHIVPVASGGKTEVNNLQTLCWRCNRNKGKKTQKYI